MSTCKSCGAEIFWAMTTGGKVMPIDPQPERRLVLTDSLPDPVVKQVDTYTSHFATCPDADQHRKS